MEFRRTLFRWALVASAITLLSVAVFYSVAYLTMHVAVGNSGLRPFYRQSLSALWLGFCLQAGLCGVLSLIAAFRPISVSRPMIVICGLLPLAQAVLMLSFVKSFLGMLLVSVGALLQVFAALLWPSAPAHAAPAPPATAPDPAATQIPPYPPSYR